MTPLTEHPCDGCHRYGGVCVTDSEKFPHCRDGGGIVNPLERHLEKTEFKLKGEKKVCGGN